jgi:addiction module HigA family antidote
LGTPIERPPSGPIGGLFFGSKAAKLATLILSITIKKGKAMQMKNPVHPGLLVKECLDDLGLTVAEAAAALHITRQQLHNIVSGRSSVTPEMAIRFEKAFGSTADTWLRMQVNYDLAQVRQRASEIVVERLTPKVA